LVRYYDTMRFMINEFDLRQKPMKVLVAIYRFILYNIPRIRA
jgi:hypothetical protein